MDKRNILAFVLIGIVLTVFILYNSINQRPAPKASTEQTDSTAAATATAKDTALQAKSAPVVIDSVPADVRDSINRVEEFGPTFAKFAKGQKDIIHIETDLVKVKINTKGATILEWELKKYKHWAKYPTQLIFNDFGELYLSWETRDRQKIDSRDLYFAFDNNGKLNYQLAGSDSLELTGKLEVAPGKYILRKFKFYGDKYYFVNDLQVANLENEIASKGFKYSWMDGLRFQENNSVDEFGQSHVLVSMNGSTDELKADDAKKNEQRTGKIDYAAIKIKYFAAAIIPQPAKSWDGTVNLAASKEILPNSGQLGRYGMEFLLPYNKGNINTSFKVFIGPLDYDIVKEEGLEAMMNFGWTFIIRPIGEYFMLPFFKMVYGFVGNYGVALIFFALVIKFILYPLSVPQLRSAQKMKLINPQVAAIREKYKDDNTKQQQEIMKLYSEYGINPAGGCLPLLLQMPILWALWAVMTSSIDLRQAEFVSWLWISDLSMPDVILALPFKIPIFGIDKFSGLALLMGITMFIQQKMTVTDPRQKAMIYMMPIMFTFMFSSLPGGLNLYYFVFNILSIGQQFYMEKLSPKKLSLEQLKRMPKKEGFIQRKMREAQEMAASQGRTLPGQNQVHGETSKSKYQRGRTNNQKKK